MLNQIRSHASNLAAKLLLAFLVLTFGIWGIGDMIRHTGASGNVATVGDKAISMQEYQFALRRETDRARESMGTNYSPELLKSLNLPQHVVHDLVQQKLLALETASLQVIPTDADVVRRIRSNQAFQNDKGEFDKKLFEGIMRRNGMSEKTYVDRLRQDIATSIIVETISAAAPLPQNAVDTIYAARHEERAATLYTLSAATADIKQPDDKQVEAYYHDHEKQFTAPEYRTVSYVSFTAADAQAKATVSDADLKAAYQDRLDEFKTPEHRVVDQLIFDSQEKAKKAVTDLRAGSTPEQVGKSGQALNKNAIAMGKVDRSQLVEAAQDPVFALPKGGISDPIQSPFGWHVFRVTAIEAPGTQTFEEARPVLLKDLQQKAGEDALNKMANSLEDALAAGSTMQEAAKEFNLAVHTAGPFDHAGKSADGSAAKLPDFDKFIDTAFKTDEKSSSSLVGSKGGVNYLLAVDKVTQAHLRPFDEVKAQATAAMQHDARATQTMELAATIAQKFADPKNRENLIAADKLRLSTFGPSSRLDPKATIPQGLMSEIFTHKPGDSTAAYPLQNGDYVLAVVKDVVPAAKPAKDSKALADIREELGTAARRETLEEYLRYLGGKYPVSVNQALLAPPPDNE